MKDDDIRIIRLEKHPTRDVKNGHVNGSLIVVWRDWDDIIENYPKMIYLSSVNAGEIKGPHLHTKRDSYFMCIRGKVLFVIRDKNGKYKEIQTSENDPLLLHIPKNNPSAHLNLSDDMSQVLVLADLAWKANDDEMKNVSFDDYDWSKWKKTI